MKKVSISCVICSYNRERYIAGAIESLVNQTLSSADYEVIIIDNNSTDNTANICASLLEKHTATHNIYYFKEKKQGLSHARNRGIDEANSDLICYIDDDAIAEADFLENIVKFFEQNPETAGVGGKIIPRYVDGKPNWMNHFMEGLVSKVDNGENIFQYDGRKFPIGCNMTYQKSWLEKIGRFDPDLGRKGNSGEASEEKDVFMKIFAQGGKVFYLPNAGVEHVIEQNRLQYSYIQKISAGIGRSEKLRVSKKGFLAVAKKFAELVFKFAAAILIAFYFMLKFEPAKAKAVIQFRINVFRGWFATP